MNGTQVRTIVQIVIHHSVRESAEDGAQHLSDWKKWWKIPWNNITSQGISPRDVWTWQDRRQERLPELPWVLDNKSRNDALAYLSGVLAIIAGMTPRVILEHQIPRQERTSYYFQDKRIWGRTGFQNVSNGLDNRNDRNDGEVHNFTLLACLVGKEVSRDAPDNNNCYTKLHLIYGDSPSCQSKVNAS